MACMQTKLLLNRVQSINKFVTLMNSFSGRAVLLQKGRCINAKSLAGVYSLNEMIVTLVLDGDETEIQKIYNSLLPYI